MSPLQRLRRVVHWVTGLTVALQVALMIGLTVVESILRRRRKPYRFPVSPPVPVRAGEDEVTVHTFGRDLYEDMLAAIEASHTSVMFETYIWKGDRYGHRFKRALVDAANRGVQVHVVYDAFANLVVPPRFFDLPDTIHVARHPVIQSLLLRPRTIGRDHRKLLIVDHEVAYIGGYNVGDLYADRWRDTHAKITGPSVAEVENAFIDYWNMGTLGITGPFHKRHKLESPVERRWDGQIEVHRNTPRWAVYPIRNMYLEAIDKASERVWLTQAYLIPDGDLVQALHLAARRGVDVRIIVPAKSNHVVADWLSRGFYADLLRKGVRLFLYQGAMVHAKTAVVDGVWCTIGTANLDRLSLAGNYEVNAAINSPEVAARMEEIFAIDEANCVELTHDEWVGRSIVAKATENLLSPWRPFF